MTLTGGYQWVDALEDIVYNYNHTWHSSIGMKPVDFDIDDFFEVWNDKRKINDKVGKEMHKEFKIGDHVRVQEKKEKFDKGATESYSNCVYEIIEFQLPISYVLGLVSGKKRYEKFVKKYVHPYYQFLKISKNTVTVPKKEKTIKRVKTKNKIKKEERAEDIKKENIIEGK